MSRRRWNRRWIGVAAAFVVVALFFAARRAATVRPKVVGNLGGQSASAIAPLQISPDGQWLLTQSFAPGPGFQRQILLWNLKVTREPRQLSGNARSPFRFSKDGHWLAARDANSVNTAILGKSLLWDLRSQNQPRVLPAGEYFFSPDSRMFAIAGARETHPKPGNFVAFPEAHIYDAASGKSLLHLRLPETLTYKRRYDAAFSPDGQRFSMATPRYIYHYSSADGQLLRRTRFDEQSHYALFSPDASRVLRERKDQFWVCDAWSGKSIALLPTTTYQRYSWYGSPDGKIYWQGVPHPQNLSHLRFWDARTGTVIRDWITAASTQIHFTPDSQNLVVVTPNGLEVREAKTGKLTGTLPGPTSEPITITPDGNFIVSSDNQGTIWKWRLR